MEVYMSEQKSVINSSWWDPSALLSFLHPGAHGPHPLQDFTPTQTEPGCVYTKHMLIFSSCCSYLGNRTQGPRLRVPGTPKWKRPGMLHLIFPLSLHDLYLLSPLNKILYFSTNSSFLLVLPLLQHTLSCTHQDPLSTLSPIFTVPWK